MLVLVKISKLEMVGSCLLGAFISVETRSSAKSPQPYYMSWGDGKETHTGLKWRRTLGTWVLTVLCLSFFIP